MDALAWQARCAARLRVQWPRLQAKDTDEAAAELWNDDQLREMEPEQAAVEWLRRGVLAD